MSGSSGYIFEIGVLSNILSIGLVDDKEFVL